MDTSVEKEIRFQGSPVSEGVAIGFPFFLPYPQEEIVPTFPISMAEVDSEIDRYRKALFSSREDLERLQNHLAGEGSCEAMTIFNTHIEMLQDPLMTTHIEEKIRQMQQNTESVFHSVINEYEERFSASSDSFFQQRLIDVMDVSKRILGHLCPKQPFSLADIPANAVIFAKFLVPSHTVSMEMPKVNAFVTQMGGGNSHTALIARAKGIPYVDNIDVQMLQSVRGACVIVNGQSGEVIFNPSKRTLARYQKLKETLSTRYQLLEKETHLKTETRDGHSVEIFANVEQLEDVDLIHRYGACGIGLFRTEYLFLQDNSLFHSEEKQYIAYRILLEKAKGLPVVIRVLDIGGDKTAHLLGAAPKEPNPVLGCRGIRFLLRYKEIFRMQARAIVRASAYGPVQISLPLIADVGELLESKELIRDAEKQLGSSSPIPIGCMIEVPSAVFLCDFLALESDFLSIGTNDLIQYALGMDRSNPLMSDFCFPAHPSMIRMLKIILAEAAKAKKPVSICGEVASNPSFIPLLLGLGCTALSCSPRYIPIIKRAIREASLKQARRLAEKALSLNTARPISDLLLKQTSK